MITTVELRRSRSVAVPSARPAVLLAPLTLLVVVLALLGALAVPAGAHTALLQASPGPAQRAGGTIEFIDLAFTEPVSDAVITVMFEGEPVAGSTTTTDGHIIRFALADPIETPGRYDVTYEMTSFDFDETLETYFFTYAPDAPEPARLGVVETGPTGTNWARLAATIVLAASLAGLLGLFVWRLDSKRRQSEPGDEPAPR